MRKQQLTDYCQLPKIAPQPYNICEPVDSAPPSNLSNLKTIKKNVHRFEIDIREDDVELPEQEEDTRNFNSQS